MSKTIQIAIVVLACASLSAAQSSDYKKREFYFGYSLSAVHNIDDDRIRDDPKDYRGVNTSITRNVSRYAGLKFDFSGQQKIPSGSDINRDSNLYNFLGGFQIKDNSKKAFKPFVHALVGVAHIHNRFNNEAGFRESDTAFASVLGGGIDISAGDQFDIRIIQIDYNPTRLFDSSQRNFRIGIGIVFH